MCKERDLVIALSSIFVAIMALIATLIEMDRAREEMEKARKHREISVQPKIEITRYVLKDTCPKDAEIGFSIINSGLGPAVVKAATLCIDDDCDLKPRQVAGHFRAELNLADKDYRILYHNLDSGSFFRAGAEPYIPLKLHDFTHPNHFETVKQLATRLSIRVEYSDLYGNAMRPEVASLSSFKGHQADFAKTCPNGFQ